MEVIMDALSTLCVRKQLCAARDAGALGPARRRVVDAFVMAKMVGDHAHLMADTTRADVGDACDVNNLALATVEAWVDLHTLAPTVPFPLPGEVVENHMHAIETYIFWMRHLLKSEQRAHAESRAHTLAVMRTAQHYRTRELVCANVRPRAALYEYMALRDRPVVKGAWFARVCADVDRISRLARTPRCFRRVDEAPGVRVAVLE
jgi:hypothetical protein